MSVCGKIKEARSLKYIKKHRNWYMSDEKTRMVCKNKKAWRGIKNV